MLDVAHDAGVSRATVSLVVRGSAQIPEATAQRVRESMDRTGYVYNRVAGQLRGGSSPAYGLLLTNARNPYLTELIMALEQEVEATEEVILTTFSLGGAEREERLARKLAGQGVAGLIMLPSSDYDQEQIGGLTRSLGVPIVLLVRDGATDHDRVVIDDRAAGLALGRHLREQGVRTVHFIGGYAEALNYRERLAGLREGIGADDSDQVVAWPDDTRAYDLAAGADLTEHVVQQRPDALVTFSDVYAVGVYAALRRLGLEPGREIAVASFDDLPLAQELGTPLTSVGTAPRQMASEALRLLRRRIDDPISTPERSLIVPELTPRQSTLAWQPTPTKRMGASR